MSVKSRAKDQLQVILTGWVYFTRIPLPARVSKRLSYSQQSLNRSAKYLPLVGILVGLVAGGVYWAASYALGSRELAVLLSMLATILVTGAFHEDGVTDFFDAFGGGWWSRDRILEIMKDSRVGTFGSLALLISFLLKYQSLVAMRAQLILPALVAAHAFSRFAAASFIFTSSYVRKNDESYFKPIMRDRMSKADFMVAGLLGILPILLFGHWQYLLLAPTLWIVRSCFGAWFIRKLGGYTGDCLGATQQVVEISFYLGAIMLTRAFSL